MQHSNGGRSQTAALVLAAAMVGFVAGLLGLTAFAGERGRSGVTAQARPEGEPTTTVTTTSTPPRSGPSTSTTTPPGSAPETSACRAVPPEELAELAVADPGPEVHFDEDAPDVPGMRSLPGSVATFHPSNKPAVTDAGPVFVETTKESADTYISVIWDLDTAEVRRSEWIAVVRGCRIVEIAREPESDVLYAIACLTRDQRLAGTDPGVVVELTVAPGSPARVHQLGSLARCLGPELVVDEGRVWVASPRREELGQVVASASLRRVDRGSESVTVRFAHTQGISDVFVAEGFLWAIVGDEAGGELQRFDLDTGERLGSMPRPDTGTLLRSGGAAGAIWTWDREHEVIRAQGLETLALLREIPVSGARAVDFGADSIWVQYFDYDSATESFRRAEIQRLDPANGAVTFSSPFRPGVYRDRAGKRPGPGALGLTAPDVDGFWFRYGQTWFRFNVS